MSGISLRDRWLIEEDKRGRAKGKGGEVKRSGLNSDSSTASLEVAIVPSTCQNAIAISMTLEQTEYMIMSDGPSVRGIGRGTFTKLSSTE